MKKTIRGFWEFFQIIGYCSGILWETSRKFFIIRMLINIVSLSVPFAVITFTRLLINLLAGIGSEDSQPEMLMRSFLIFSLLLLALNILNKGIGTLSTYYTGLHRDRMDTVTKHRIMKKASELDLSFFDSAAFYNEVNDASMNSPLVTNSAFLAMDFVRYLVQFMVAFVCLFPFSPLLPIVFVLSVIPCTVAELRQVEAIYGFQRQYMSEERKMQYASDVLLEREFAKDVRIYNLFPFISRKFLGIWEVLFSKKRKISLRYTRVLILLSALPEIVAAVFLFLLGLSVLQELHTIGDYSL